MDERNPVVICPPEEGRTVQSSRDETDINFIYGRYVKTGLLPSYPNVQAIYGDAPAVTYQEALHLVQATEEAFLAVPAEIRAKFQNDPGQFVDFCTNPANQADLVALGLAPEPEIPDSKPAEVVKPAV